MPHLWQMLTVKWVAFVLKTQLIHRRHGVMWNSGITRTQGIPIHDHLSAKVHTKMQLSQPRRSMLSRAVQHVHEH